MIFTTKAEYGVRLLIQLGRQGGDQPVSLKAMAEAAGYQVQKAKLKAACGEIYALDRNGARVELFVDPTSGQIVGSQ